ncbi:MAG: DUF1302 family protein [Rhizobiales bacterium]|nr:DUF1302 family protein [Hyphomicrobiales bacterium]
MSGSWKKCVVPALLGVVFASPAVAFEFNSGELHGNFDTTVSVGTTMRVSGRDCRLIGTSNGGCYASGTNQDDGDLNFDKYDFTSASITMTNELAVDWQNYGAFFRVNAYYDPLLNSDGGTRRTNLSDSAKREIARGVDLLDAYGYGLFDIGGHSVSVRLGQQAISWGEALFTIGGVNQINPLDASKIRQAGSDIKQATIPTPSIDVTTNLWSGVSLETYYQFIWRQTQSDPVGTFFSKSDPAGSGAQGIFLASDPGAVGTAAYAAYLEKRDNRTPRRSGQWGAALRYFDDDLGAELAAYYIHYHLKTPIIGFTGRKTISLPGPVVSVRPYAYFEEYVPDMDLFGASFNTSLFGSALGGEISYQPELAVPLAQSSVIAQATAAAGGAALIPPGFVERTVHGYTYTKKWQASLTDIAAFAPSDKFFGPVVRAIGADSATMATEVVGTMYPNLDSSKSFAVPVSKTKPTKYAWGYRLSTSAVYPTAFGTNVTLAPSIAFQHDVQGTVPDTPAAAILVDDRKTLTLGVGASYLSSWSGGIYYTNYFGAGGDNLALDRDFVSLSLSYAF